MIRTTANRENAQRRRNIARNAQLRANQEKREAAAARRRANQEAREYRTAPINSETKCELFWFNGATSYTHGMGRRRVHTEKYPGYILKFRSAPQGTLSRIMTKLLGLNRIFNHRDPQDWLSNMYQEVKMAVKSLKKVVIAGHSHGGLITTIMAENLNKDPEVTDADLKKVYVVTFNSIRLISKSDIPRIKLWQIVNEADVASAVSHTTTMVGRLPYQAQRVTNANNVLWNHNKNFTWKFTPKTTHSYLDRRRGIKWLWRRNTGKTGPIASHKDYDFDEFIAAVENFFKKFVATNTTRNVFKTNLPFANPLNQLNSVSELSRERNNVYNAWMNASPGNKNALNTRLRNINNRLMKLRASS
jgi:hypothetical protein